MKIGVIGAGTMGQGIAKAFAQVEGNTVALCDIKQEWAENGLAKIKKGYEKLVAKGKMTQEKADAIVAAITPGLKEDLCADCDLVVEAAFEDMKVKQTTFGELDKMVDTRPGSEWFWQTDKYGTPAHKPIVEPRKCPYHNGRMCMELMRRNPDVNV